MATPLLLVVHGRAGGTVPAELQHLAAELGRRRNAPVGVQALTAAPAAQLQDLFEQPLPPACTLSVAPLMLLPGEHVRADLPAIAEHWRRREAPRPVKRLPFVGAWPAWQRALAAELAELPAALLRRPVAPLLLHHPLEGPLASRYLSHLQRVTRARCVATAYSAEALATLQLTLTAPVLPLALAANRLTDQLADQLGPPLLQRARFRQVLLDQLEAVP
jgi:sirohydrochlorin ferrochelatase